MGQGEVGVELTGTVTGDGERGTGYGRGPMEHGKGAGGCAWKPDCMVLYDQI